MSWGQALYDIEHGPTQLMQPAVGELHLGLDANRTRDAATFGMLGQIIEERGLAHARLTAEHDDSALPGPSVGQELVERLALRLPPQESDRTVSPIEGAPFDATLLLLGVAVFLARGY